MLENILSGDEYANVIIESVLDSDLELPKDQRMDPDFTKVWSKIIRKEANRKWSEYITGKSESYLFNDDEFTETFQKATEELVSETLSGLVEKNLVQLGVGEDGDILYSLTDEGKMEANKISDKNK
jgi:hypothetical protein